MAFQRATPPALRWVALFLAGCAVLGLTLGFRDQMRRNPPAWYTGGKEAVVPGAGLVEARDAVAIDPLAPAPKPALQVEEAPKPKAEESKADEAVAEPVAQTPEEKAAAAATPPTSRPKPPPPKIEPSSEDPVGDLLESQKAPTTPPNVPY